MAAASPAEGREEGESSFSHRPHGRATSQRLDSSPYTYSWKLGHFVHPSLISLSHDLHSLKHFCPHQQQLLLTKLKPLEKLELLKLTAVPVQSMAFQESWTDLAMSRTYFFL